MLTHSTHQGFYDNEFYKPIYLLTYLLTAHYYIVFYAVFSTTATCSVLPLVS